MDTWRLAVGIFDFQQRHAMRGRTAVLCSSDSGALITILGPFADRKVRHVGQQCESAGLFGAHFGSWFPSPRFQFGEMVAVLDEKGRPWAFCGPLDHESRMMAAFLADNHDFREAVRFARANHLFLDDDPHPDATGDPDTHWIDSDA